MATPGGTRWGTWAAGAGTASLMVAVAVTGNQAYSEGRLRLAWLAGAIVSAALTVAVDRRLAGQTARPVLQPDTTDDKGRPLPLGQLTPRRLGVHPSRFGPHGDSPYVERDRDPELAAALRDGDRRFVVVQGPRLAGTTSTLAQAAHTHLADLPVLAFLDDPRVSLAQMLAQSRREAARGPGAVLWLDDLRPHGLGELLAEDLPAGVWALATLHDEHTHGFRIPEHVQLLLEDKAVQVTLGTISGRERDALRAEEAYTDLQPALDSADEHLMGRLMVALDQIHQVLTPGRDEDSADRIALLRAVTDWYRSAVPALLTRRVLTDLYTAYRREAVDHRPTKGGGLPVSLTRFQHAVSWATKVTSRNRPQLVDLREIDRGTRYYTPHPLLTVAADDTGQPGAWPIADALWEYADQHLHGDQRRDVGYTALNRGANEHAAQLLDHTDTRIEPEALYQIGRWLFGADRLEEARRWWTRTVTTDHPDHAPRAMAGLGVLEDEQGHVEQARHWFTKAIATDHPDHAPAAMFNLGALEDRQGHVEQARHRYTEAIATDHADHAPFAMVGLGALEDRQGHVEQARHWYTEAIATGHADEAPAAMRKLGTLEDRLGRVEQARHWYMKAAATGHADVAPKAMGNLGVLEDRQGRVGQARHWYTEAIATGHADEAPAAMVGLGALENGLGRVGQARHWYMKAAATGHADEAPSAMFNLGVLEDEQGRVGQARHWYTETIATGHADVAPKAMGNLGVLEDRQGRVGQARHWYTETIATGHADAVPSAMFNLGVLEDEQGRFEQARHWYTKAIATDHSKLRPLAEQRLRELGQRAEDLQRAQHFGRYGWQAYADPTLMNRDDVETGTDDLDAPIGGLAENGESGSDDAPQPPR